jgi:hypothetical protein
MFNQQTPCGVQGPCAMDEKLLIMHVERVGPNNEPSATDPVDEIAIEVITGTSISDETRSIYITKNAADDLVQMLGKYLLALE